MRFRIVATKVWTDGPDAGRKIPDVRSILTFHSEEAAQEYVHNNNNLWAKGRRDWHITEYRIVEDK